MRHARNLRKSTVPLLILTALLAGCGTVPQGGTSPVLSNPPPGVVDALEKAGRDDPNAAAWVVDLDKFYQKQDKVTGR